MSNSIQRLFSSVYFRKRILPEVATLENTISSGWGGFPVIKAILLKLLDGFLFGLFVLFYGACFAQVYYFEIRR